MLSTPTLDRDALYQLIAMSRTPIGRGALLNAFGNDEEMAEQLETALKDLTDEKLIMQDGKQSYCATKPWADIAYAVVGFAQEGNRVPVQILNLPIHVNINATLSYADFQKNNLTAGSQIVVGLNRTTGHSPGLRARFLAHVEKNHPFRLTGTFNQKSGVFSARDRTIKTDFTLTKDPAEFGNLKRNFAAEVPLKFDIRFPVISIVEDQNRDINTGESINLIVSSKHGISHAHPKAVLRDADLLSRRKIDYSQRVDLRHLPFVTVDPEGAEDLDDAFYAETEGDGYALYTAIADVASLVSYGSTVDREAYQRGITFYLADDHTTHMLPPSLSTRKCSLIPKETRPAIVVKQSLDKEGALKDFEVCAAVIRSREQLAYNEFYKLLSQNAPRFRTIAKIHDIRRRSGLNSDLDVFLKETPDKYASKSIVETLMVQTNSLLAKFLKAANVPFLSRNFESNGTDQDKKRGLIPRAYYASHQLGHANLGLLNYGHFTSPIRRYADIVNLRALHTALGTRGIQISDEEVSNLDEIARHLNNRRRLDRDVTHDIEKYHAMQDLVRLQVAPVRANINEIGPDYIEISIAQTGLRSRIPDSAMPANQWRIDKDREALVLLDAQGKDVRSYKRGDTLLGQLYDVDPTKARWKIALMPSDANLRPLITPAPKIA